MESYKLFIGSNNNTHKVELSKIKVLVSEKFEGFTIIKTTGYWRGTAEKSVIVEIMATAEEHTTVSALAESLKIALEQQAIMMTVSKPEVLFI